MTETIIKELLINEIYFNKVFPYLKEDYFDNSYENNIFKVISKYYEKYSFSPSTDTIKLMIEKTDSDQKEIIQKHFKKIMSAPSEFTFDFLLDETEEFIKNTDLKINMVKSVEILTKDTNRKDEILPLLEDSLSIHFDNSIGLEHADVKRRHEFYRKEQENGFKCDIPILNELSNGGFKRKNLVFFVAPPHGGKSAMMTHLASSYLLNGYNVLYITLEMAEEKIYHRIDANTLNIKLNEFKDIDFDEYNSKVNSLIKNSCGELIVKEYPTASANSMMIRALLKDLKQKKDFKPDIIFVDYVGIMAESSDNMYTNIKRNSEQLRGLAVENDCLIVTASQTNRGGMDKNGLSMTDLAESTGPAQIADGVFGISKFSVDDSEDEKETFKTHQILSLDVLKNRDGGLVNRKILLELDFRYMRISEYNQGSGGTKSVNIPALERKSVDLSEDVDDLFDFK